MATSAVTTRAVISRCRAGRATVARVVIAVGLVLGSVSIVSSPTGAVPSRPASTSPTRAAPSQPTSTGCPAAQPTGTFLVALGDSYSAGEGLGCYLPRSNVPGGDQCHRSTDGYPELIVSGLQRTDAACSGAVINDMFQTDHNGWGEPAQIDRIINSSTGIVTVTIGGNDAHFPDVLAACVSGYLGSLQISYPFGTQGGHDCAGWESQVPTLMNGIGSGLTSVYKAILAKLPRNGKLVVGTYPELFPSSYTGNSHFGGQFCVGASIPGHSAALGFIHSDVTKFITDEALLNNVIRSAITSIYNAGDTRIRLADMAAAYPDNTVSCGDGGSLTPFVNGIVLAGAGGVAAAYDCVARLPGCSWSAVVSDASFHPRIAGQRGYASVFDNTITGGVPLSIITASLPGATAHMSYLATLHAVGGAGTLSWAISSGSLPAGLILTSSGRIKGTPTNAGAATVTMAVTDQAGTKASHTYTLIVRAGGGVITIYPGVSQPWGITAGSDGALWFTNQNNNSIGRITTAGVVTNYTGAGISGPTGIAAGPDGALWFTNNGNNSIGRITTAGAVANYTGAGISGPTAIAAGPDGALWFTNYGMWNGSTFVGSSIGRITTVGAVTGYTGTGISAPFGIAAGPDGALWFTSDSQFGNNSIGRITTAGVVTNYTDATLAEPSGITAGPDGALWFTNNGNSSIGRITTAGRISNYTDPSVGDLRGITAGSDGALWFTSYNSDSIGRITTTGVVTNYTPIGANPWWGITARPDGALWFTNFYHESIGRITTSGAVTNYTGPINKPGGITSGPDGAIWFTNYYDSIGRITTSGAVTNYTGPGISSPENITTGPDGALWFTNCNNNSIGRITTAGVVTNYTAGSCPDGITTGSDSALWFTNGGNNSIGRITTTGAVTNYTDPGISYPNGIAAGSDGALWFTNNDNIEYERNSIDWIGRITPP
jgi:streptogramin lyase